MTARIAVVVPAHNEGPSLEACLNSLASQAVPIRIMVSDNGSTDGTPDILERLRSSFEFDARRVEGLGPSEHFASCGRWALEPGASPSRPCSQQMTSGARLSPRAPSQCSTPTTPRDGLPDVHLVG